LIVVKHVFCFVFFSITENLIFRLRDELNRSNEQVEEYRQIIYLLNEKNFTTNIDDLNRIMGGAASSF
jgi:benzoyl-CoA reductase/2-hydroxyglutaryl-CoA dehydratase subunit BcrC/BadD/HgdB